MVTLPVLYDDVSLRPVSSWNNSENVLTYIVRGNITTSVAIGQLIVMCMIVMSLAKDKVIGSLPTIQNKKYQSQ